MNIAIVGTGYVGLVTGVGFASLGHTVTAVDVVPEKIEQINRGESPIYEKDLESLLQRVLKEKKFEATANLDAAVQQAEIVFLCVGTPSREDGSIDLKYVEAASASIGKALKDKSDFTIIVVKSTVIPGTTEDVVLPLLEKHAGKTAGKDFGVSMCPEFLREGLAVEDFLKPQRVVIGSLDEKTQMQLHELYTAFNAPLIETTPRTAELTKYACNAFLATKLSFINELTTLGKMQNVDTGKLLEAMKLDPRIGSRYLSPGLGFGGSCLPKDVNALIAHARAGNYEPKLLEQVLAVNAAQAERFVAMAEQKLGTLNGKKVALLGLAFKPGTDDVRESPAVKVAQLLVVKGAKVRAYDPEAIETSRSVLKGAIQYAASAADAVENAELILLVTEWPEFKDLKLPQNVPVLEGRKLLENREHVDGLCW